MEENKNEEPEPLEYSFINTIEKAKAAFGEHAFRRWDPKKSAWKKQVLASLYDAEMFGILPFEYNELAATREKLTVGLKKLFENDEFRKSIDAATNTPALFQYRINAVREMISGVIG